MDYERYSRQIGVLGEEGQAALERAKVVVVGAGGLGNTVASLLARMNVSRIRIIDSDLVEVSNLPRCMIFDESDVGRSKAEILKNTIAKINSSIKVGMIDEDLNESSLHLLDGFDIIMDCTDNMNARHLINRYSIANRVPWVYGSVSRDVGFVGTFSGRSPCFACAFPEEKNPPEDMIPQKGLHSAIPNIIGSIQVSEAVRVLTGNPSFGKLVHFSLNGPSLSVSVIRKNPRCGVCKGE